MYADMILWHLQYHIYNVCSKICLYFYYYMAGTSNIFVCMYI